MISGEVLLRRVAETYASTKLLSPIQRLVDDQVCSFVAQASDLKCLIALSAGSLAYRGTRSVLAASKGLWLSNHPFVAQSLSTALGLSAESLTYLKVSQILTPHASSSPFFRDFSSTFVSFSVLKSFSSVSADQNLFLQHFFTDSALIAAHQVTAHLGLTPKPEGDLATQLVQAEALNWQLKAGTSLTQTLTPEITDFHQALSFSEHSGPRFGELPFSKLATAMVKGGDLSTNLNRPKEGLVMMSQGDGNESSPGLPIPYRAMDPEVIKIRNLIHRIEELRERMIMASRAETKKNNLREYQELVEQLPKDVIETSIEMAEVRKLLPGSSGENTKLLLDAYETLTSVLRPGDHHVYQEAKALQEMFTRAQTQQDRWSLLKGLEILGNRFKLGDPDVYENAQWVRMHFHHHSAHTQRQAFLTYRALVSKFAKGHPEVMVGETQIRLLDDGLDTKTQEISRETLNVLETKLPLSVQFRRFGRRLFNLSILTRNPKI